jgi:replicative DNA helicase
MSGSDRTLPAATNIERLLMGSILLGDQKFNQEFSEAAEKLIPEDFSLDSNRRIFARFGAMVDAGKPINTATLMDELLRNGQIESVGGLSYLNSLTEERYKPPTVTELIRIVKEKSMARQLINACDLAAKNAFEKDAADIVGQLQTSLEAILLGSEQDDPLVSSYGIAALDEFERDRKTQQRGLSYGISSLDSFTGGMRKGEVTVVGARSGVGKTSLMVQTAVANCRAGIPVHLFSLEMTRQQILQRIWSIVSKVPHKRISDGTTTEEQAKLVRNAAAQVLEWPLRIHDNSELSLNQIVAAGRLSIRRHGTRFIAVDYAQEVDAEGKDERTRVIAVCRKLARMVKHENCSLMLLSQLVKLGREHYNKPPVVTDLVESGKLENVAHCIVLLHRGWDDAKATVTNEGELIIPKQRRGATGVKPAHFNHITLTFEAMEREEGQAAPSGPTGGLRVVH